MIETLGIPRKQQCAKSRIAGKAWCSIPEFFLPLLYENENQPRNTKVYFMRLEEFKIRSYGFQELAQLYLPNIQPRSASARLKAWINRNKSLSERLDQVGFIKGCRVLTPEMVKEIVGVIGEP